MNLFLGILLTFIAQSITFIQLQGSLRYQWLKDHRMLVIATGMLVTWIFMYSVKYLVCAFDGQIWPSRLIGFAIGAIAFTILSIVLFGEPITTKTAVSLILSLTLLLMQLFWK